MSNLREPLNKQFLGIAAFAFLFFSILAAAAGQAAIEEFLSAYLKKDTFAMGQVVKNNRYDMTVSFFAMLNETASLLDKVLPDEKEKMQTTVLLTVAAELAQIFAEEYPRQNVLYKQFEQSKDLLTSDVGRSVDSDETLAKFLQESVGKSGETYNWSTIRSGLKSIIEAATESPDERIKRHVEKELQQRQQLEAARIEREKTAALKDRIARLSKEGDTSGLLETLNDPYISKASRLSIIEALGELRSSNAVSALDQQADADDFKESAVVALGKIANEPAIRVLIRKLDDSSVQASSKAELIRIGGEQTVSLLIEKMGDDSPISRQQATSVVSAILGEQAVPRFLALLEESAATLPQKQAALWALGSLRDARAVNGLLAHLDSELQGPTIQALAEIGGEQAANGLVKVLDHPTAGPAASAALMRIGKPALPAILRCFQEREQPKGIKLAGQLLEKLGYQPKTAEEKAWLRLAQLDSKGVALMGPIAVPTLLAAMATGDPEFRSGALRALIWQGLAVLVTLLLFTPAVYVFLRRGWIWPRARFELKAGEQKQCRHAITLLSTERKAEPGTILRTSWAYSRRRKCQRIKVETFAVEAISGQPNLKEALRTLNNHFGREGIQEQCDLLVSVGVSVKPGQYLAKGPDGAVLITVKA